MTWMTIAALAVGTFAIRAAGLWFGSRPNRLGASASRAVDLVPAAMLAALVALQTFGTAGELAIDARVAGVAVAGALVAARAPFIAIVLAAAAVTALVRALGVG